MSTLRRCELKTCLDDPDRVRCCPGYNTSNCSCSKMDIGVFLSVIEVIGDDLLAVTVRVEIYRTRGYDADQGWAKSFKERSWRLIAVYVTGSRDLNCPLWVLGTPIRHTVECARFQQNSTTDHLSAEGAPRHHLLQPRLKYAFP
jgi:hypothetical protein